MHLTDIKACIKYICQHKTYGIYYVISILEYFLSDHKNDNLKFKYSNINRIYSVRGLICVLPELIYSLAGLIYVLPVLTYSLASLIYVIPVLTYSLAGPLYVITVLTYSVPGLKCDLPVITYCIGSLKEAFQASI